MKKTILLLSTLFFLIGNVVVKAQEAKKQPASPPASVTETLSNGTKVTINYAQPGIKGRTIGKEIAPYGKVWRTGANAATQFEVSKDVKINGKSLAAGKYALFTIPGEKEWVVIFNKTWDQWGNYKYKEAEDALRFTVKAEKAKEFMERMTFTIAKNGEVALAWGDVHIDFMVK
ncbi:DUF2911 domain-containing protein [Pedobacter glucosidilyticus]|uniref:DUF2911 domain-containing protein n=1 Tax=Pedobacter glucosidilyticus TaxID=1122941 RepID=UPI0026EE54D2|nr:DUF2911 domain-containing protein [Pedobacter glucosidilyticus]